MTRILVVFTGGTIGSTTEGTKINVDAGKSNTLLQLYKQQTAGKNMGNIEFVSVQPFTILSENIVPEDWLKLQACILGHNLHDYDGIIITHGSDTLAYTAAAVSYLFASVAIPIILTASNYPLDDYRSKGLRNFIDSVSFIVNDPLPGVFVVFENDADEAIVHLGTRIMQAMPFTDEYESMYNIPYGKIEDDRFHYNPRQINPFPQQLGRPTFSKKEFAFSTDILYIKPYPGMRYSYFNLHNKKPQAILHDLYHSGTTCTLRNEDSLESFIQQCERSGIDFYIAPIKDASSELYVSSHELLSYGAMPLENITVEAALVKLMLAYGTWRDPADIKQFMQMNIFHEFAG